MFLLLCGVASVVADKQGTSSLSIRLVGRLAGTLPSHRSGTPGDSLCTDFSLIMIVKTWQKLVKTVLPNKEQGVFAFCFKCRSKRKIKGPERVATKNYKQGIQGLCECCGTRVFTFEIAPLV